ncbi:hypothetical protein B6D25_09535, partial [Micrococcus luteus]
MTQTLPTTDRPGATAPDDLRLAIPRTVVPGMARRRSSGAVAPGRSGVGRGCVMRGSFGIGRREEGRGRGPVGRNAGRGGAEVEAHGAG